MTLYMTQWKSTREAPKTKAELREMLAEAVRNTNTQPDSESKRLLKTEKRSLRKA
jgi:hypothetical protein